MKASLKGSIFYQRQHLPDKLIKLGQRRRFLEKQACSAENVSISVAIFTDVMKDIFSLPYHTILTEGNTQRSSKRMDKDIYTAIPFTYKKTNIE